MGYHGTVCPRFEAEAPGTPHYFASLKRDAVGGKLFQGGTIAWLVQHIEQQASELAALRHRFETEAPVLSIGPVTGHRLLASLACHIDHDEPPGMAARQLAKSALALLAGLSSFQVVMLGGHLGELAQKFKPGQPGEGGAGG
jgi:hypothetical protein